MVGKSLRRNAGVFLAACLALCWTSAAGAKTWQEAIDDVAALADTYAETVTKRTGNSVTYYYGTMHHPTDWKMHMCAILGRRLGFAEHIGHLEPPQPSLSSPPEILAVNYVSLNNWVAAAQKFAGMSQHQRATHWNLECVGNMGTPNSLWVDVPTEVFFEARDSTLYVYGDIVPGFSSRLAQALVDNPSVTQIGLGSGGGMVIEAIRAGQMLRDGGYDTVLIGECYSACPLAFLGGVNRSVFRHSVGANRFGFHQISANGIAIPNNDSVYAVVYDYVMRMGGNAEMILLAMQSYRPAEMGYFDIKIECPMRIATWYQGFFPGECPD